MLRAFLAALLLLPLAACDETGGLDAPVDLLVDDAIAARESGDVEAAIEILRAAYQRAPDDATVRVELATSLLRRDDLNLLDLDQIGQYIINGASNSPSARSGARACGDGGTAFNPADAPGFQDIIDKAATLAEADDLLSGILPDALRSFDICTSVRNGELVYDRAGALGTLRAAGLDDERIAQGLAVNAAVQFLKAYTTVSTALPAGSEWYRMPDGSIVICVTDEAALRAAGEDAVRDLGETVISLDARASLVGDDSVAAEIVDVALDAYEEVRDAIADFCS